LFSSLAGPSRDCTFDQAQASLLPCRRPANSGPGPPPGPPAAQARAKLDSEALRQGEAAQVEARPVLRPHAARVGIGSRCHWACAGFAPAADPRLARGPPAHAAGRKAIVSLLRGHRGDAVAVEPTGTHWAALYERLAAEGPEAPRVGPGHGHRLRG